MPDVARLREIHEHIGAVSNRAPGVLVGRESGMSENQLETGDFGEKRAEVAVLIEPAGYRSCMVQYRFRYRSPERFPFKNDTLRGGLAAGQQSAKLANTGATYGNRDLSPCNT